MIPVFNRLESAAGAPFLKRGLKKSGYAVEELLNVDHHTAHSAAAFYKSPFDESLVVSLDGYGDGSSGMVSVWDRGGGLHKVVKKISYLKERLGERFFIPERGGDGGLAKGAALYFSFLKRF